MTTFRLPVLLTIFLATLASCSKMSSEHLPYAKMEAVMMDMSIAEAYSTKTKDNANFGGTKNLDTLAIYYKEILAHHNLTQEQFTQSLTWYKHHPDDMDSVYSHLATAADKLNLEESKKVKVVPPPAVTAPVAAPPKM